MRSMNFLWNVSESGTRGFTDYESERERRENAIPAAKGGKIFNLNNGLLLCEFFF